MHSFIKCAALLATATLGLMSIAGPARSAPETALAETIARLEADLDARIGLHLEDVGTGWTLTHRADERFLMASTFKSLLCGAVLAGVDAGEVDLGETVEITSGDLVPYAPVVEDEVGNALTLAQLCRATLDMSDNAAANLLTRRLGGPAEVTTFLRGIGDAVTRIDRWEPDLNTFAPGDPRDTTSPSAIAGSWKALLLGDALSVASAARLETWMGDGGVTGNLLRASTPADWEVADKSGGGLHHTRNLVALVRPEGGEPWLVAIYLSDTPADWDTRNAAIAEIGAAVVEVIEAR
ncbi:class A beta-lactamase [Jannaschia marina]|uniref:class A beta-lactamase n=1 Tax=Jannaschia marina TaxID=2741674 RepID=UPI0015C7300B|nr:class A beta-lactamase [Jannaschia marina]